MTTKEKNLNQLETMSKISFFFVFFISLIVAQDVNADCFQHKNCFDCQASKPSCGWCSGKEGAGCNFSTAEQNCTALGNVWNAPCTGLGDQPPMDQMDNMSPAETIDPCQNSKRKRQSCEITWKQAKSMLIGNNCGYSADSSLSKNWKDDHCVVKENACIPPQGSTEKCQFITCSDPQVCKDQMGQDWECGTFFLVEDDGTSQTGSSQFVGSDPCDASSIPIYLTLWFGSISLSMF